MKTHKKMLFCIMTCSLVMTPISPVLASPALVARAALSSQFKAAASRTTSRALATRTTASMTAHQTASYSARSVGSYDHSYTAKQGAGTFANVAKTWTPTKTTVTHPKQFMKLGPSASSSFKKAAKPLPEAQAKAVSRYIRRTTVKKPQYEYKRNPMFVKQDGKPKLVITYAKKGAGNVNITARGNSKTKHYSKEFNQMFAPSGGKVGTGMKHTRHEGTIINSKTYGNTTPIAPIRTVFHNAVKR